MVIQMRAHEPCLHDPATAVAKATNIIAPSDVTTIPMTINTKLILTRIGFFFAVPIKSVVHVRISQQKKMMDIA